jgi:hypothetical protein
MNKNFEENECMRSISAHKDEKFKELLNKRDLTDFELDLVMNDLI